ncbi:hypothetical protein HPB52_010521 [Rhipicephalus sanguineus]|uniref:SGNH hydrolase-type esterase domain-containing protein n=1 Tax=Rhipicephalus sanguineus TaxID=34632 RepID=A0A9D4T9D4_RHISA|nr:hypothetical protein HPB52_010521 [Rhipicephalus sanguineus]
MPAYSRPATGAPPVEQLSRKFPKHPPTTAIIGNSQTRYLHRHFNPHDRATPAIITIRGASTFDIEKELADIPRSVTTLVFHVGTSELASYGLDESLRRLRRLVNNTLRTRQELERLVVSCVLPRYPNQRLERSNEQFVHRFNREARQFNETVKAYCRRPSKVSYVDYQFEQLPPRRFLAADGLHPSFMGVALIAETLKSALGRGDLEATTGWSTQPTAPVNIRSSQQNTHDTNPTYQHVPGAPRPPNITAEFPTIGETVTPARPKHPLTIINSAPLLGGNKVPRFFPVLKEKSRDFRGEVCWTAKTRSKTARPEELHDSTTTPLFKGKPAELRSRVPLLRTPGPELPTNTDILPSTIAGSPTPESSLQRRRPAGHNYNLRTSSVPSPHPKED